VGAESFNDGAGMGRLTVAAQFVHDNMPNGTDWRHPVLSSDDAWDVAAFVLAQKRPHMEGLAQDWPDRAAKPADAPYGPYADGFPVAQHRLGPFAPIRAALAAARPQPSSSP